ncbi:MAG TPA: nucleoside-triphosphatase [Anaerolineales bacterium]|nr:nucleoside-triphosphatase [Anaerolineales bacterium]
MTQKPSILIISGARASGKTTFCTLIAEILSSNGWDVAGIFSLPVIKQDVQIAKETVDLRSGARRSLARINFQNIAATEVQTGRWIFDTKTLTWCNAVFRASVPCDFLVIDEIGPLEFNRGQGFLEALTALDSGEFICAMAVVRPELLSLALERWPTAIIIELTDPNHAKQQAHQLAAELTKGIHPTRR